MWIWTVWMLQFFEMVRSKPTQKKAPQQPPQYRQYPPRPDGPPEVVHPMWLLKALAVVLVAALVCGYGALCLLLYQGQWQLILHPARTTSHPAEVAGAPVEFVRFGPDETAVPQLTGWTIPAAAGGRYAGVTVLFLPSGDGSLADSAPTLGLLHGLGLTVFGVDYRGYGESVAVHPNQERMMADADASFVYLTTSRGIPARQIVPYGVGLGASLAAHLAAEHGEIPGVIVDSPAADPLATVEGDPRTHYLPVKLLLHDRFPLADLLATLKTPKLLLLPGASNRMLGSAADPKMTIELPERSSAVYGETMTRSLTRFLDAYITANGIQQMQIR
ncbi:alpha/beta hydrolase [Granulicella arctica]|uniref:Serine aminopeptidase S33 domain-containing protein n=1 Tax=Granulicella arctica TaxID=940613 RepID=A0A7Y9TGW3_9BACT|nr:alpha/beta hydrolase [Granulicella arctica]NYF80381.1 hypothetical protein [Granulicella arctica]